MFKSEKKLLPAMVFSSLEAFSMHFSGLKFKVSGLKAGKRTASEEIPRPKLDLVG